jgi:uncharacterized protein (DUF2062 family)
VTAGEAFRRRVGEPVLQQLTQGLSPDQVALTCAVGLCIAIIPVIGVTTALSFFAAWALKLNQPVIQTINWSSYPLQLLMIFPFIRLGEKIFGAPRLRFSLDQLVAMGKADPFGTMALLGSTLAHAVVAWLLVCPVLLVTVYFGTRPLFRVLARRVATLGKTDVDDVA